MTGDGYFGEWIAARYDEDEGGMFAPEVIEPTVDFLAGLAGDGPALEFGIGTGRIALPLAARGIPVHGIDLSRAMVERMRAKPGGHAIDVTIGDFATTRVERQFRLAYLVFNTINNLTTQAEQVACFRNAAAHLAPGGAFVIEVGVPPLRLVPPGQRFYTYNVSDTKWDIDEFDFATQQFYSHHFSVRDGQLVRNSIPFRYVWPAELDLMAQMAGMELTERWENWQREPFTAESRKHVSVWKLPEA
ncbi:MAG TPA: class I SAM-dependent methyltransferase [Thermomicrobiales bacterium]|nr:class I SAM-dependent methyltransferase [Thermomicrobiales bacterium]